MEEQNQAFIDKLNAVHQWPDTYTFKFIGTGTVIDQLKAMFPDDQIQERVSSKGKFISATIKKTMFSAEEVLVIYTKAKTIEGIISL